jgi:secreted protein with Ig-like and vWFA domain
MQFVEVTQQIYMINDDDDGNCVLSSLSEKTMENIKNEEFFRMMVNNTGSGDGGIAISFGGPYLTDPICEGTNEDAFTVLVNLDTLKEMIHSLQIVYDSYFD